MALGRAVRSPLRAVLVTLGSTGGRFGTEWVASNAMGFLTVFPTSPPCGILQRQKRWTVLANVCIAFRLFSPISLIFVFVKEELLLLGKERASFPF